MWLWHQRSLSSKKVFEHKSIIFHFQLIQLIHVHFSGYSYILSIHSRIVASSLSLSLSVFRNLIKSSKGFAINTEYYPFSCNYNNIMILFCHVVDDYMVDYIIIDNDRNTFIIIMIMIILFATKNSHNNDHYHIW